jgi:hypothetical protein
MMNRHHRHVDDDDDSPFDAAGVLRDGATARVPMMLRDAALTPLQRAVAQNVHATLHDGHGNRDVVGHRPGFIVDANANDARQTAYDEYRRDVENAWRGSPAREYPASAEGSKCTVRGYKYRDHFGAPGPVVNGECVPDELQRDALPARDDMTFDELQCDHQARMQRIYDEFDRELEQRWRAR